MSEHVNHIAEPTFWDILVKSDLLNVIILAIAIIYLGNKYLPKIIDGRKNQISKELEDAKQARIKAAEELKTIQEKTKNIAQEIEEIKNDAKKTALTIKTQMEKETEKEIEALKLKIQREIAASQEEAIQNIKKSATDAAVKMAEEALSKLSQNKEVQDKLTEDFLFEISKPNKN